MTYGINNLKKIIFFLACFSLIFDNLYSYRIFQTLSNGLSNKASWYFLLILAFVIFAECLKNNARVIQDDVDRKYFKIYLVCLIFLLILSNVLGFFLFPYWNEVYRLDTTYVKNIRTLINYIPWDISQATLLQIRIFIKSLKMPVLDVLFSFGFSIIVYSFIRPNIKTGVRLLIVATWLSTVVILIYSFLELQYFAGSSFARKILEHINFYLHPLYSEYNNWPPLLWYSHQVRSVFSEPSRVGNYAAFALPLLWTQLLDKSTCHGWKVLITYGFMLVVFMSQARTAISIFVGLAALSIVFLIFTRNKTLILRGVMIALLGIFSFWSSLYFINNVDKSAMMFRDYYKEKNSDTVVTQRDYIENQLLSLGKKKSRSNASRYAYLRINFKTGIEHPVFGVGNVLTDVYAKHNLSKSDLQVDEIRRHFYTYISKGPFYQMNFGAGNEYVQRFASTGFLGLSIFLLPFAYILIKLMIELKKGDFHIRIEQSGIILSMIGCMVAGMNGSLMILYTTWIILPFAYCIMKDTVSHGEIQ